MDGLRHARGFDTAARLWLLGAAVVALAVWPDYGVTWDELWHMEYGDHILAFIATLGDDRSALSYRRDFYYGGGFDLLGAIVRRLDPSPAHDAMHRLGAVVGVVGLAGTWQLGRRLGGPAVGMLSLVLLTVTPVWWGHMFNNPKDLPFAVGYVWGLVALVAWLQTAGRPSRRTLVGLAVALGIAASVRIGGVVLMALLVAATAVVTCMEIRRRGTLAAPPLVGRAIASTTAVLVGAWAVMLAPWPWAQSAPIARPLAALSKMSRFDLHERVMPFAGEPMSTTTPRWDYLVHYVGLKTPLFILMLVGGAIGLAIVLAGSKRWRDRPWSPSRLAGPLVATAVVAPTLYAMLAGSVLYDGMRHFLFILPPLAVMAGWAAVEVPLRLAAPLPILAGGIAIGTVVLTVRQVVVMVDLHPHEYVHFNRIAGDLAGASGRYSTDYYGNSYKEAFERMFDELWARDPETYLSEVFVVTACMPRRVAELYLPPNARFRRRGRHDDPPDLYVAYTREGCAEKHRNAPLLVEVTRRGTTLAVARDLRPLYPSRREDPDD